MDKKFILFKALPKKSATNEKETQVLIHIDSIINIYDVSAISDEGKGDLNDSANTIIELKGSGLTSPGATYIIAETIDELKARISEIVIQ